MVTNTAMGKNKVMIKQTKIKKYSSSMLRKLMAAPRPISFNNCANENGKFLPVNFSSVLSESKEKSGERIIKRTYFEKVPEMNQKIIFMSHNTIKLK